MKKIIKREKYFNLIKKFIGKNIIKVIIGQRRVGKSYMLLQLIEYLKNKGIPTSDILYINKEDIKFEHIKNYNDLYNISKDYKYIFIDEIQEIYQREKAIITLQNENKDIYISGSNSNLLSGELATYISGRYVSFQIYPLDYKEFLKFHNLKKGKKSFKKYIKYGGLPYLINFDLSDDVFLYLSDVVNTIIFKDIIKRFNIRNIQFLNNLLIYLSKNIGNIFSAKNISDYLKSQKISISVNTVLEYIKYLKLTFIIDEINRFDIKGKKIFELKNKYYFEDIGIRNAIIGGFNDIDINGILENIVYTNLVSNGWKIYIGELYNYEIDFICEKGNEKMYIQVSYLLSDKNVIEREFRPLLKIKDSYPKYVLTLDEYLQGNINGIKHLNIIDFIYSLC